VFEGKVAKIEEDPGNHRSTATLEVSRVWKGAVTAETSVTTHGAGSMCGFTFVVGGSYLRSLPRVTRGRCGSRPVLLWARRRRSRS